jgi:hypothetical protein
VRKTTDVRWRLSKSARAILEAEMDNHAERQDFAKTRACSVLDWPTPEQLAAAHRARGKALREMVVAGARWLRRLIADHVLAVSLGRAKPTPAKVRVAHGR